MTTPQANWQLCEKEPRESKQAEMILLADIFAEMHIQRYVYVHNQTSIAYRKDVATVYQEGMETQTTTWYFMDLT